MSAIDSLMSPTWNPTQVVITFASSYPDWSAVLSSVYPAEGVADAETFNEAWAGTNFNPDWHTGPFAFDSLQPPQDDNLFNGSALSNISPEHKSHPERQGFDSSKDIKLGSTSALEDSEIMNLISTIEREEQDEDERNYAVNQLKMKFRER